MRGLGGLWRVILVVVGFLIYLVLSDLGVVPSVESLVAKPIVPKSAEPAAAATVTVARLEPVPNPNAQPALSLPPPAPAVAPPVAPAEPAAYAPPVQSAAPEPPVAAATEQPQLVAMSTEPAPDKSESPVAEKPPPVNQRQESAPKTQPLDYEGGSSQDPDAREPDFVMEFTLQNLNELLAMRAGVLLAKNRATNQEELVDLHGSLLSRDLPSFTLLVIDSAYHREFAATGFELNKGALASSLAPLTRAVARRMDTSPSDIMLSFVPTNQLARRINQKRQDVVPTETNRASTSPRPPARVIVTVHGDDITIDVQTTP